MSDRTILNQRRLPTPVVPDPVPAEVVVVETVATDGGEDASVSGETERRTQAVHDAELTEAVMKLSDKMDTIVEMLMCLMNA